MKIKLKKIIYTLVICLISFYTTNVFAINECTKEEKSRLQELANNIKIKYDFKLIEDDVDGEVYDVNPIYKLKMLNSDPDLRYEYKFAEESEKKAIRDYEIGDLEVYEGDVIDFYIYSYTNNLCTNQFIKKIRVVLPTYNRFYYFNKEDCLEYSDFKYCQEFMDISNLDYEQLEAEFSEYIDNQKKENESNFFKDNLVYIIISILVLVIIAVVIIILRQKKKHEDL